jgi:hypothetical protein
LTGGTNRAKAAADGLTGSTNRTSSALNQGKNSANNMTHAVNAIPNQHTTSISADTRRVVADVMNVIGWIDGLTPVIHVVTSIAKAIGFAEGGVVGSDGAAMPIPRFADGGPNGLIQGRGTGTSDSNLIAASHGEYMVNAVSTAANMPLLEHINAARGPVNVGTSGPSFLRGGGSGGVQPIHLTVMTPPPDLAQQQTVVSRSTILYNRYNATNGQQPAVGRS